jgi:hypothetical protein
VAILVRPSRLGASRSALALALGALVVGALVDADARADEPADVRGPRASDDDDPTSSTDAARWARHLSRADVASTDRSATDATPAKADKPPRWETAKPERRGGFAMGMSVAAGLGASNGYPNDSKKIGRSAYYTESGLGLGTGSGIWLGGALADWLSFGFGFGFSTVIAKGSTSPAPLGFFHTDVFPLYALGGGLRDLGTTFEFGLGFPKTVATKTETTIIEGGGSSFVFAGVFWEPLKVWKLRMGPLVGAHYLFSESIKRPLALAGFRLTLYTAP